MLRTNTQDDDGPLIHSLEQSTFEFNVLLGAEPALAQIDNTHFLCAYTGPASDGWCVVAAVDVNAWTVSRATTFEFDNQTGLTPALAKIDNNNYLCAYAGVQNDG